jgi:Cu/Ag efflux protein CusF
MDKLIAFPIAALLSAAALAQASAVNGEVTRIDPASGRITLKHGEIKPLDMPPMTMAYRAREPKLLDGVAVGDRVRFVVEKIDGQYTLTAISKLP